MFFSIEPVLNWQPVIHPEMVKLLDEMEKAVFDWLKKGGHKASA
jgi:hypothetical protein